MPEYIMRESGYPGRLETEIVGELTRCKDCKYYRRLHDQDDLCQYTLTSVEADDYCSYAERKEGETNG